MKLEINKDEQLKITESIGKKIESLARHVKSEKNTLIREIREKEMQELNNLQNKINNLELIK